jgi:hypothetical protein
MKKSKIMIATIPLGLFLIGCGGGGGGGTTGDGNNVPVADAGQDQRIKPTSLVSLNGSGSSDADGDTLTYNWSFVSLPAGSSANLSDPASQTPTFTADLNGTYVLSLSVNDGTLSSGTDTVKITAATYDFGPLNQAHIDLSTECNVSAGTTINGGNIINQTWNAAGSPYIVLGDITIPGGSTLTIEAGTTVCMASTDAMAAGLDDSKVEITNNGGGILDVNGSVLAPVTFRSMEVTTAQTWRGLISNSLSESDTSINHALIANASVGVAGHAWVKGSVFMHNGTGVHLDRNSIVDASVFLKNTYGVDVLDDITITNLLAYQNTCGIRIYPAYNYMVAHIDNCTIDNNTYGIADVATGNHLTFYINNSILTNNNYGIYSNNTFSSAYINYSDLWNNSTPYSGISPSLSDTIAINPLYIDTTFDYSLSSGSPAIDAGENVSISTDLIGTVRPQNGDGINGLEYDMGAYEMPGTL